MVTRSTRRVFLGGLAAIAVTGVARADAPVRSLRPQLRSTGPRARSVSGVGALIARHSPSGQVACAVADVKTGLLLESHQGDVGLPPASVAKALTALYALDVLGPEYKFQTNLLVTGTLTNGILDGDLILAGGGDPTLDTNALATLAGKLKVAGVREVRGAFKVYEGTLPYVGTIDPSQPDHVGYSPAISGIALNFNRVHFEWKRSGTGYSVAMDARSNRFRPEVDMARMRVVNRKTPIYTYKEDNGLDHWTVASKALGKGGSRWLPVRRPALYAGDVFRTLARSNGIVLPKESAVQTLPADARIMAYYQSDTLKKILRDMLKYSTNLTAEMVGMSATAARSGKPVSLQASAGAMSRWAADNLNMGATGLVDHSGLGDASRMSAQDLVGALVLVRKHELLRPLLKPIALRDTKGRVNKGHPIKVNAKTGTLNFVSGLGGFMTAADGTELAFAIFVADTKKRAQIRRADREIPPGARDWNRRAKRLQQRLIERWGSVYGS